jgi:preprotein translocase subunit SecA
MVVTGVIYLTTIKKASPIHFDGYNISDNHKERQNESDMLHKTTINDFAIDVVASIIKCQISVHL